MRQRKGLSAARADPEERAGGLQAHDGHQVCEAPGWSRALGLHPCSILGVEGELLCPEVEKLEAEPLARGGSERVSGSPGPSVSHGHMSAPPKNPTEKFDRPSAGCEHVIQFGQVSCNLFMKDRPALRHGQHLSPQGRKGSDKGVAAAVEFC